MHRSDPEIAHLIVDLLGERSLIPLLESTGLSEEDFRQALAGRRRFTVRELERCAAFLDVEAERLIVNDDWGTIVLPPAADRAALEQAVGLCRRLVAGYLVLDSILEP